MELSAHIEGDLDAMLRVKGRADRMGREIEHLIKEAAAIGNEGLKAKVPRSGRHDHPTISAAVRGKAEFKPGGAGGGGYWEARVGIDEERAPSHLKYVLEGTGRHGPFGTRIDAGSHHPFTIMKEGALNFRMWSGGQRPNRRWLTVAQGAARAHIIDGLPRITNR